MQEKVNHISLSAPITEYTPEPTSLDFQVYSRASRFRVPRAGVVTDLKGLESAAVTITGGTASYGGSVYTGVRAEDREVRITVRPYSKTLNEIKYALNLLVAQSMGAPLTITLHTTMNNDLEYTLKTNCYISEIAAPILSQDPSIQIVLKCPKPYFDRDAIQMATGYEGRHVNTTIKDSKTESIFHVDRDTEALDRLITAPSPFLMTLKVPSSDISKVESLGVSDPFGNTSKLILNHNTINSHSGLDLSKDAYFQIDTKRREISMSSGVDGIQWLKVGHIHTRPFWPMLYPGIPTMKVVTTLKTNQSNPISLGFAGIVVYPRVFGV